MYINFCNTFIFHITLYLQSSLVRVSDLFPVDTDNDTVSNLDFGRLILYDKSVGLAISYQFLHSGFIVTGLVH